MHQISTSLRTPFVLLLSLFLNGHLSAQTTGRADDYSQLTQAAVADALSLSDAQKASIATILQDRDKALAEAEDGGKQEIQNSASQKLSEVLTEAQHAQYIQLIREPRLKFNFRFQKWGDVLDWVTDEAGLSLVMDEPPPGTFNYSDDKEYTPTEAIDLLNGWLLTKGYTLVRRERLLMCLNLQEGLPEGAIPRVAPEELATRGRFEFVSVLIPLEGRTAETVLAEITPLLGTYGQAEMLAATQQLLVADSAQSVKTIQQIVEKVPVPSKPAPPKAKPPAPKPELQVYPIEHANPKQAGEVLQSMISGSLFVDEAASQISINAVPAEHVKAKIIIDQLESNQAPDKLPVLKLYPARISNTSEMMATLQLVFPNSQFRYDEASRKLVAWAPLSDHARIGDSLEELLSQQRTNGPTQLEVYQLDKITPETAQTLITSLLPEANVTLDPRSGSLIAVGTLAEHQAIRALLEQLEPQVANTKPAELRSYPIESSISDLATSLLTSVVPEATVTTDAANKRLLVVAPPEKHEVVSETLVQLAEDLAKPDQQLKSYDANEIDTTSLISLLATLAPTAQVTTDTANHRLLIIASEGDHATVENVLQQVGETRAVGKPVLKSYALNPKVNAETITSLLGNLAPTASVTSDAANRRLLITANEKDHELIAEMIAQVAKDAGGELPELQFYPLLRASGSNAASVLQAMLPAAIITFEESANRLTIVATQTDHEVVRQTLSKLEEATPVEEKRTLKIYGVTTSQRARFTAVLTSLNSELPGLQVLTDAQPGEMTVWAKPSQHKIVTEVLAQLERDIPPEEKPKLVVYPITKVDPESVSTVLVELFPDAKITTDTVASRLLIHAKPALQETIASAIEQLDSDLPVEVEIKLMVYPIKGVDPNNAMQLLSTEVPKAVVIHDTTAQTLIVRARLEQQQQVAELLEELQSVSAPLAQRTVVVYPSSYGQTDQVEDFFQSAFPDARFVIDSSNQTITAIATAGDHEKIRAAVETMSKSGVKANSELKEYSLIGMESTAVSQMLSQAVPKVQVVVTQDKLLAWGLPEEQILVQRIISGLKAAPENRAVSAFDISPVGMSNAQAVLSQVVPEVSFLPSADSKSLIALVDEETKLLIESTLNQLADSPVADVKRTLKFYQVDQTIITNVIGVLASTVPEVTLTQSVDGSRLMAIVTESQHQKIEETLNQIAEEQPFRQERTLQFYSVSKAGTTASSVLTRMYPNAVINDGAQPGQLMIEATAADHLGIKTLITRLEEAASDDSRALRFYDIEQAGGSRVQTVLSTSVPAVSFTSTSDGKRLLALVTPEEHTKIEATLSQLMDEKPFAELPTLKLYSIRDAGPAATTVIGQAVPTASISSGARPDQIAVVANANDHEKIQKVLDQLQTAKGELLEKTLAVYDIRGTDPAAVQTVLQSLVDSDVQITVDPTGRRLYVRAFPSQQTAVKDAVEEIASELKPDGQLESKTYYVGSPNADEAQELLMALYPDATIVVDSDRKMLMATATPEQHVKIAEIAKQIAESGTAGASAYPVIYKTENVTAEDAEDLLDDLFSQFDNVRVSVNDRLGRLVVIAREEQHHLISQMMDQFDGEPVEEIQRELAVYRVQPLDALSVKTALESLVSNNVTITGDRKGTEILVSAPAEEQAQIADLVKQMTMSRVGGVGVETRTYRLLRGEADEAQEALEALFPDATLVTDLGREVLVATASPEQHKTIEQVVQQMTGSAVGENSPLPKTYRLHQTDGETVIEILEGLFSRADEVRLSLDEVNQTVVAIARPDQHRTIETLLADLDPEDGMRTRLLQEYSVVGLDGNLVQQVVNGVLQEEDAGAQIVFEGATGNLLVTTTQSGHELAKQTVARFRKPEPTQMEVFQLTFLEPFAAQMAIDRMISSRFSHLSRPQIHADDDLQQLWVRASRIQIDEMRSLLVKMGEVGLAASHSNENLRTIPVGDNVDEAIQRVQDLWPRLRPNPIRILKKEQLDIDASGQFSIPPKPASEGHQKEQPSEAESDPKQFVSDDSVESAKAAQDEPAEITIVPEDGRVTIASDDVEALDQLESLLRAIYSRPSGGRNRDFSVYQLTNAGAADVATSLHQIFEDTVGLVSFGEVVIVPDERLNALIVYASRSDRRRIEELLEVLDSELIEDTKRAYQTKVIPLQYADANQVEDVIQGIYRAQMTAGGARSSISIPKGVPSEVATVLRQINAAASSPLLTIEVQLATNSLIVKAPQNLMVEVSELIDDLDEASHTTRARGIRLIPLKKTNSSRAMQILKEVLD